MLDAKLIALGARRSQKIKNGFVEVLDDAIAVFINGHLPRVFKGKELQQIDILDGITLIASFKDFDTAERILQTGEHHAYMMNIYIGTFRNGSFEQRKIL